MSSTTVAPVDADNPAGLVKPARLRLWREIRLVFVRSIRPTLRRPVSLLIGMSMSLLYLALFGPLLHQIGAGGAGSSWQWFVPGMMVQTALFGTSYAGFALIPEIRSGALERLRVTPVSRAALLLGRVLGDVLRLVIQAVLLTALAMIFGFRVGIGPLLLGLLLLAVLGTAIGSASYALALILRQEYAFAPVLSMSTLPLLLLSGVLLPMTIAPTWLHDLSRINPLSYVVDAERAMVAGQWSATTIWLGPLLAVLLAVAAVAVGVRTFRRETA
ncbi:MAG TPA: ABC transporter permease [Pseudonocardiaceae bacterium]|jgi:ABC-2 type transport system permease protein|nr:ABC transporter permease [Pseudonocardiaceae bacterium]